MNNKNTALIVVDPQKEFAQAFDSYDIKIMSEANNSLISYCEKNKIPVYLAVSPDFGNEIIPSMKNSLANAVKIPKPKCIDSAFSNKKLLESLIKDGSDNLIITGIDAPYCVKRTAQDALKNGFNIYSSDDLIATRPNTEFDSDEFGGWVDRNGKMYDSVDNLICDIK